MKLKSFLRFFVLSILAFVIAEEFIAGATHLGGAFNGKMWDLWWTGIHWTIAIIGFFFIGTYIEVMIFDFLLKRFR